MLEQVQAKLVCSHSVLAPRDGPPYCGCDYSDESSGQAFCDLKAKGAGLEPVIAPWNVCETNHDRHIEHPEDALEYPVTGLCMHGSDY